MGRARLTEVEQESMRQAYARGDRTYRALADEFRVTYDVARRAIQRGKTGTKRSRAKTGSYQRQAITGETTHATVFMARAGLTSVKIHEETGVARSVISHAVNGKPVWEGTARRLYQCFVQHGYNGDIGTLFAISHGLGAPRKGTPTRLIQRSRKRERESPC
jgi:hypothetical protein